MKEDCTMNSTRTSAPRAATRERAAAAKAPSMLAAQPTAAVVVGHEDQDAQDGQGTGERYLLRSGAAGTVRARCAASCLLVPAVGDTVALLRIAPDELWIVAVLERSGAAGQVVRFHGDTRIEVKNGALHLDADELHAKSSRVSVLADSAELSAGKLRLVGTAINVVGSALSSFFDRVSHFSRFHLRTTEGIDRVQATHLEYEASQLLRMQAEHTLINGEKLVKARGGQIHFG